MKYHLPLLIIMSLIAGGWGQRNPNLPYRKDGKWYYTLQKKTYGPFAWVSELKKHKEKWLFICVTGPDARKGKYYVYSNADTFKKFGPYDYVNYRVAGISPAGSHFYFMAFKGDKTTSHQRYYFVINGKSYGPYTSVTRRLNFFCDDDIWIFNAVRDGKFRGRWHIGGKTRLYVMGKEYDIQKKPAGFWVESVKRVSKGRYAIKVAVDVGSRRKIKTLYYRKH